MLGFVPPLVLVGIVSLTDWPSKNVTFEWHQPPTKCTKWPGSLTSGTLPENQAEKKECTDELARPSLESFSDKTIITWESMRLSCWTCLEHQESINSAAAAALLAGCHPIWRAASRQLMLLCYTSSWMMSALDVSLSLLSYTNILGPYLTSQGNLHILR